MEFKEALKLVIKDKKIRRKCWGNRNFYITTNFLDLEKDDYEGKDWEDYIISEQDGSEDSE